MKKFLTSIIEKHIPHGFFYGPPDLGKKNFTTWNVLKSEVYLTCINSGKFHDDLKACLEVIDSKAMWNLVSNRDEIFGIFNSQWDYQMMNISRIFTFSTWHEFDEFGWNDPLTQIEVNKNWT